MSLVPTSDVVAFTRLSFSTISPSEKDSDDEEAIAYKDFPVFELMLVCEW